jgi:hypothetical protein
MEYGVFRWNNERFVRTRIKAGGAIVKYDNIPEPKK